jgi:hypothetical protein
MALLFNDISLLYVQVPATGCSVVAKMLREHFDAVELGRKHDDLPALIRRGLITAEDAERLLVLANVRNPFDRYVSYWQRLKSDWADQEYLAVLQRKLERQAAADALTEQELELRKASIAHLRRRLYRRRRWIRWTTFDSWFLLTLLRWKLHSEDSRDFANRFLFPMLTGVDLVIKQEKLEQALQEVLDRMVPGIEVRLSLRNQTPGKRVYTEYYNGLSRLVAQRMAPETMIRFGYRFAGGIDESSIIALTTKGHRFLSSPRSKVSAETTCTA